jgi:hypothetical protein
MGPAQRRRVADVFELVPHGSRGSGLGPKLRLTLCL